MKMFSASVETIFWRFHLMIAIVVISFAIGLPFLGILAVPVFLSAMLGASFKSTKNKSSSKSKKETSPSSAQYLPNGFTLAK